MHPTPTALSTRTVRPLLRAAAAALAVAGSAAAQCSEWRIEPSDLGGLAGAERIFTSALWDADGSGPNPPRLAVGGQFQRAGGVLAGRLAVYDPVTRDWSRLGTGFNDAVHAVVGMPNGDLIAGGDFFTADGTFFASIARWDGAGWRALGAGVDNRVAALAVLPNGDLIAAGYFANAGGQPASRIARWDGASWSPLGNGLNGNVLALAVAPNGDLYAGGQFTAAGATATAHVARWDGATWSPLGAGTSAEVRALAVLPNGDLVCGGQFTSAGGAATPSIARWDGAAWHALGSGLGGGFSSPRVDAVAVLPNGDVIAGGAFTGSGLTLAERIARWDGTAWHPLGSGLTQGVQSFASASTLTVLPGGDLFVAGRFTEAGGVVARDAARWNAASGWERTNPGTEGRVDTLFELADGDVLAGGGFRTFGGLQTANVARWDGASWSALGSGLGGLTYSDGITAFAELPNGDIIAAGTIYERLGPNSIGAGRAVWRWDGSAWAPLGSGLPGRVSDLAKLRDGRLVAAGSFGPVGGQGFQALALWDGTAWNPMGIPRNVFGIAALPDGGLVAGGRFTDAGGVTVQNVARWDQNGWSAMGAGVPIDAEVECLSNGDVIAYEGQPPAAYRWDGQSWAQLSLPQMTVLRSLIGLPNGDISIHGYTFVAAGTPGIDSLWRGDGTTWAEMAPAGRTFVPGTARPANFAGGTWFGGTMVDPASGRFGDASQFASLCPATVTATGTGCAGSAGVPQLQARTLPWLGSTYRAHVTNLANATLAVDVIGVANQAALPAILRPAIGCTAYAAPDLVSFQLANGEAHFATPIPQSSALVGVQVIHQLLAIELTATGGIARTASSAGLALTLGTY